MHVREFDNFDVDLIAIGDGRFQVRVDSPAGTGHAHFVLPFTEDELESSLTLLRAASGDQTVRDVAPPQCENPAQSAPALARRFGETLFDVVFPDTIGNLLHASRLAADARGKGLRIRLRVDDDPVLARVPWEYLFDTDERWSGYLALNSDTPLIRTAGGGRMTEPRAVGHPPLRVLVATAAPSGYPGLSLEAEWDNIASALRELRLDGLIQLDRIDRTSLVGLRTRLQRGQHHVLHFIGHGSVDNRGLGFIAFVDQDTGQAHSIYGDDLYAALGESESMRFVVLNACKGAVADPGNPFSGVAQTLVRRGLPAVLAMQASISDHVATILGAGLYGALATGRPIDTALASARQLIVAADRERAEWATPVLFMGGSNVRLFEIDAVSDEERRAHRIASLWSEATAAEDSLDLVLADARLQELLAAQPAHADALAARARIRKVLQADQLFEQGKQLYEENKLAEALRVFNELADRHSNHRNVFDYQDKIRERLRPGEFRPIPSPPPTQLSGVDALAAQMLPEIVFGRVALFLGADANLSDEDQDGEWVPGRWPPTTAQLASHLAVLRSYPWPDRESLVRVAQYVDVTRGYQRLFEDVGAVLAQSRQPTALHRLLVRLPALRRAAASPGPLIIISANYDDVLEWTFRESGEAFDLVTCQLQQGQLGKFLVHEPHDFPARPIELPNEYVDLPLDSSTGTVIVKIYAAGGGGYAITEDHHLEYSVRITPATVSQYLPVGLLHKLSDKNFLFLGYSLRDWHLRAFLNAVWPRGAGRGAFPLVVPSAGPVQDDRFWRGRDVDRADVTLAQFVAAMTRRVVSMAPASAGSQP